MNETSIQNEILNTHCKGDVRLFRNNTGQCRIGAHIIRYGIPSSGGGSDLLGFKTIIITPEMVGSKFAVFTAIEVKRPKEKPTPKQTAFLAFIQSAGGIAGYATSAAEAGEILNQPTNATRPNETNET